MKINALYIAMSLALLSQTTNAKAEKSDELERIEIQGDQYKSTGTKSSLAPINAPFSISHIDQDTLQLRQADSVNAALRYVSGITPESRSTVTIFDQYTIRGFESYRNYYDGLELQSNNLWNLYPQVDAFATETVEVLKGPASVLYGSAPPGGMVNQIAKLANGSEHTQVRLRIGSNALRELGIDHAGVLNDQLSYRTIALSRKSDGQQQTTEEKRTVFAPSLRFQPSSNTVLTAHLYYQDDPKAIPSTPLHSVGTLTRASYGYVDTDAFAGDINWSNFNRTTTMAGLKIEHRLSSDWSLFTNWRYTDSEGIQHNTYNQNLVAGSDSVLARSAYKTDEAQHGYVLDNQVSTNFTFGHTSHHLLFGFEYKTLSSTVGYWDTLGTGTPTIDLAAPNYRVFDVNALPLNFYTEAHDIEQSNRAFYIQDEVKISALTLLAGLRYDSFSSNVIADKDYAGTQWQTHSNIDDSQLTGRIAALYQLESGWRPYISYSQSFEPVSGEDSVTQEAFDPTEAEQWEIGIKYHARDSQLTIAAFELSKQNEIINSQDFVTKTQAGEIKSKGIEIEATHTFNNQVDLLINATYLDQEVTKNKLDPDLIGKRLVWVADNTASVWLNYYPSLFSALKISTGIRYVGESYVGKYNTDTVPSYTLLDIALDYELNEHMRMTFSVSNLADKRYVGACYDQSNCWMGAERKIDLGFHTRF
ncbi:TonB-dependent siderophore receptor [Pseudoalteromonas piscicida]|uniref:TonB-dependent siderophore receptor n=1 Tax=Pseudoalteromonas piscicida TaxID=43662 RepID=A0A2A5JUG0_PSEO7|nr:TonB-dependent siderophore receptor [Pseudoalteromonas piscicida]PCK33065.1 TonB-dependent siderophore receptor [Pseudoalteromonas piscicida]